LVRVHPSEIAGKIVAAKGGAVASAVELSLVTDDALGIPPQVVALGSDGAFRFSGVLPGQYGLIGSTRYIGVAPNPVAGGDPLNSEPAIWGFDSLVVTAGSDISGLSLTLRQPIRLSGNLTFEGSDPRPTAGAVVVEAWPAKGRILSTGLGTTVKPIRSRVRSDGTFEIDGLMPGDYRLAVAVDGRPASRPWTVSSASVRGQEVLDGWFSLRSDDVVVPVAVHLDDRPARLSGNLSLKSGAPARDNIVVAFTTNRAAWGKQSRRVVASRTDDHGAFVFDDLPAGEYRLGAVLDVMVGDLDDPAVLEALLDFTVIVSVRPGESVVQHLSVGGGVPASK
jgi:hypothetical protein